MTDAEMTVGLLAARFDDEYPDHTPELVAQRAVRNIRAADRTRLLVDLLTVRIEARRRAKTRDIEQRAVTQAQWAKRNAETEREVTAYLTEHATRCSIQHRGYQNGYAAAQACDERRYKQSPEGLAAAAEWKARRAAGRERRLAEEAKAALEVNDPEEYARLYPSPWEMMRRHLEEFRAKVRLDLTVELLGATFSLGDGRMTTWGRASMEDHEQRIGLLMQGIEGSGRTIVLHEKAMEVLAEHNAACLNDVRFAA